MLLLWVMGLNDSSNYDHLSSTVYLFLLKTESLDNPILSSSYWLSHHGIWAIILFCSPNMVTVHICSKLKTSWKSVVFIKSGRIFDILFKYLFLIKQYYYSIRACWIWDGYSQLGATSLVGYLPSHIQRGLMY